MFITLNILALIRCIIMSKYQRSLLIQKTDIKRKLSYNKTVQTMIDNAI